MGEEIPLLFHRLLEQSLISLFSCKWKQICPSTAYQREGCPLTGTQATGQKVLIFLFGPLLEFWLMESAHTCTPLGAG